MLETLSILYSSYDLAVFVALVLMLSLTYLDLLVDLVGQVHLYEVLLLLYVVYALLDVNEGLLRTKMRLVVKDFNLLFGSLSYYLFRYLVFKEIAVLAVLLLSVLCLQVLHTIHVVDGLVELLFLIFANLLYATYLLIETAEGLLVDSSDGFIRVCTFVSGMVVNCKRTVSAHEFGYRSMVIFRYFLAV